jgi:hypothetical protein
VLELRIFEKRWFRENCPSLSRCLGREIKLAKLVSSPDFANLKKDHGAGPGYPRLPLASGSLTRMINPTERLTECLNIRAHDPSVRENNQSKLINIGERNKVFFLLSPKVFFLKIFLEGK